VAGAEAGREGRGGELDPRADQVQPGDRAVPFLGGVTTLPAASRWKSPRFGHELRRSFGPSTPAYSEVVP
jgi:hypothetical protein